MTKVMRETTLQTLGLGNVIEIFQRGRLPADSGELVDRVFGNSGARGSMVISGANGIVGAGKTMQLGSRLQPFDVKMVALDFPGAPDGIGKQYDGLLQAFGKTGADDIMRGIIRMNYDGAQLPAEMKDLKPRFLLEAIPEILEIKKAHYKLFRESFPEIEIRSVTSGFPSSELGVGIAHPAFPHEINKIWEIVEPEPSAISQLFWALGLIPVPVSDNWSFVLDVLFCGVMLAGSRYHDASNMPFWKIDKFARKVVGPNPFRAHDAIGTKGATFLTWSCLHHLSEMYGPLFRPTADMEERKETGQSWYPPNHFRPLVDWRLEDGQLDEFRTWILGPLFQMTSLMLHEKRGHFAHLNAIGELCAQFRRGILAVIRDAGPESVVKTVEDYHRVHPEAAGAAWYPASFEKMDGPDWQQLYVNAEHDDGVGVITINRESYSWDVDREINRAIDWLKSEGIDKVIVTGDFHLSTQMVGADTSEFFPTLDSFEAGYEITSGWSATGRRLNDEFAVSVAFVNGKRCLGGMLELLVHCHYVVSVDDARLGWPEVTLPVVPGMEGCHWPLRKARAEDRPRLLHLLLTGRPAKATDTEGWLVDYAGPMDEAIQTAWKLATGADHGIAKRAVESDAFDVSVEVRDLPEADSPSMETARAAIIECVRAAAGANLSDALTIQAKHAADFLASAACREGVVGAEYSRTMAV
jgi:enoyl-CoA hydratase/carnithine racemase